MEFGPREVLVVLGALLICGIVLDGVRRMRAARRGSLRGLRRQPIFDDESQDSLNSELPSGGARVVAVRDDDATAAVGKQLWRGDDPARSKRTAPFRDRLWPEPEADDEVAPVMAEAESVTEEERQERGPQPVVDEPEIREPTVATEPAVAESEPPLPAAPFVPEGLPLFTGEPAPLPKDGRRGGRRRGKTVGEARPMHREDALEAVVLHLMAPQGSFFTARPLFQALQDAGLEFGERHIFHRPPASPGATSPFSVANAVKPGTFEGAVRDFQTPGVAFFLVIGDSTEPLAAFDDMLATARTVAAELGAELCDERRSALTRQVIADYRQRIVDHSRRAHTR